MTMRGTKISICITTFNRSELLEDSILNVLNQTHHNLELFVVDDCSSSYHLKRLKEIESSINDDRLKVIYNDKNIRLSACRNLAISLSTGDYFSFKDDDDGWDPSFLSQCLSSAIDNDVEIVCTGFKSKRNHIFDGSVLTIKAAIVNGYTPPVGAQFYNLGLLKILTPYSDIATGVDHDLWINLAFEKPTVRVLFLDQALVEIDKFSLGGEKMTTNFEKRYFGIETSLEFWKPKLVSIAGEAFYLHFVSEYRIYIANKFIVQSLKTRNLGLFLKVCGQGKLRGVLLQSLWRLFKFHLLATNKNMIKPLFRSYQNK